MDPEEGKQDQNLWLQCCMCVTDGLCLQGCAVGMNYENVKVLEEVCYENAPLLQTVYPKCM